ncbi:MAG TPA: maleylacetate reductase [Nocardioides sp.]|nr:maleylacetate reductase [Nocardioides sp.]
MRFTHDTLGQTVVLEAGAAAQHLVMEVERLGASRVMLVAGSSAARHADRLATRLPVVVRWDDVAQHVPLDLAERARTTAERAAVDLLVCVGGGSAVGLAKAVALTHRLPIVAVPTTYAGSEATAVWGLTEDRTKRTGSDPGVLPRTVVYDSDLTLDLPVDLSVASGLNALAHSVDTLWADGADPVNEALALEGARALAVGLPMVVADPRGREGRDRCLYGGYLAATAFASAGSGLHHKICHVLGGTWDLPHAATHAVVLPHVLALNAPAVPRVAGRLACALGGTPGTNPAAAAVTALEALRDAVSPPRALREIGMPEDGLDEAVRRVLAVVPASNPVAVTAGDLRALLRAAWEGADPTPRSTP